MSLLDYSTRVDHTGGMRVLLKLVLDCDPDDAWRAIRSPHVFQEVSHPLTQFKSLEVGGFPELWQPGEHPVKVSAFGRFTIGQQIIRISFDDDEPGIRIMRDTGRGLSGPLALVSQWNHSMAISATPDGRTLYRDRLNFNAGLLSPLVWPMYWAFWQWRGAALKRLAPTWSWGTTRRTNLSL
ncbi:hypothetical protein A20C1_07678 [marine actinobacterium PHSC20C1]|nr:hypothetical protein A20C1_07678 [marine actinobacterium PHSC20C1]